MRLSAKSKRTNQIIFTSIFCQIFITTLMTLKNAKLVFKEFSNDSLRNRDRTILHQIVPCNAN